MTYTIGFPSAGSPDNSIEVLREMKESILQRVSPNCTKQIRQLIDEVIDNIEDVTTVWELTNRKFLEQVYRYIDNIVKNEVVEIEENGKRVEAKTEQVDPLVVSNYILIEVPYNSGKTVETGYLFKPTEDDMKRIVGSDKLLRQKAGEIIEKIIRDKIDWDVDQRIAKIGNRTYRLTDNGFITLMKTLGIEDGVYKLVTKKIVETLPEKFKKNIKIDTPIVIRVKPSDFLNTVERQYWSDLIIEIDPTPIWYPAVPIYVKLVNKKKTLSVRRLSSIYTLERDLEQAIKDLEKQAMNSIKIYPNKKREV